MKYKEPTYIRKRNIIYLADGKTVAHEFKSINQAKLKSRSLQGGNRGCGIVRVDHSEDQKPPKLNFTKLRQGSFVRSLTRKPTEPIKWEISSLDQRLRVKAGL